MRLILPSLLLFISSALFAQESMRMPPGSLVRQSLCKITNDNLDFSDVVELARNLPRDETLQLGFSSVVLYLRHPSLWKIGTLWLLCTIQTGQTWWNAGLQTGIVTEASYLFHVTAHWWSGMSQSIQG